MRESLLIVTGIYAPEPGGPAKFARDFGKWCSARNVRINIVSYTDDSLSIPYDSGLEVSSIQRNLRLPSRLFLYVLKICLKASRKSSVLVVGGFIEVVIASFIKKFDYVAKVPGDIVWERARNKNLTELDINDFQSLRLPFKYRVFRSLFTLSLRRANKVIVPSLGLKQLCVGWGIPESTIQVIYNGTEVVGRSDYPINKEFDVITVCRLVPWKGVEELIGACSAKGLSLLIVGDGPERTRLEDISNKLKGDVIFTGNIEFNSVIKCIQHSKIFVLNSSYEGLPHALIEARSCNVFSIARENTGSAEVITHMYDGILISEKFNLGDAFDYFVNNPEQIKEMVQRAYLDTNSRFDKNVNYHSILKVLGN